MENVKNEVVEVVEDLKVVNYVTGVSKKNQNVYSQKVRNENLNPINDTLVKVIEKGLDKTLDKPKQNCSVLKTKLVDQETGLRLGVEIQTRLVLLDTKEIKAKREEVPTNVEDLF